jgi:hypothetical protein
MDHPNADSELNEDHLLNFVVNMLDDELPLQLAESVKTSSDDLYEDLNQPRLRIHR